MLMLLIMRERSRLSLLFQTYNPRIADVFLSFESALAVGKTEPGAIFSHPSRPQLTLKEPAKALISLADDKDYHSRML